MVQIEVKDNGCGMNTDVQEMVFEPFFTTKSEGTGLGLTMTQSILQDAKGNISIHSIEEQGTCFTLQFPYVNPEKQYLTKQISNSVNHRNTAFDQTILVVDDNDDVREVILSMLSEQGYLAVGAREGREALLILEQQKVDLIISDSIIPTINGLQLWEQIEKRYPKLPFVMMTGFSTDKEPLKGFPIIEKPISLQVLVDVCEQCFLSIGLAVLSGEKEDVL